MCGGLQGVCYSLFGAIVQGNAELASNSFSIHFMHKAFRIFTGISIMVVSFSACDEGGKSKITVASGSTRPLSQHNADMMQPMDEMIQRIESLRLTGDFDYDFVSMLIEHNRGANGMAKLEIEKGTDQQLQQMARRIISRNQIAETKLVEFLKVNNPIEVKDDSGILHHAFQDAIANTVVRMRGLIMTANIDKDFAMMMIPHHETSNEIFNAQLVYGKNKLLNQLAGVTTTIQKRELDSLNVWAFENK